MPFPSLLGGRGGDSVGGEKKTKPEKGTTSQPDGGNESNSSSGNNWMTMRKRSSSNLSKPKPRSKSNASNASSSSMMSNSTSLDLNNSNSSSINLKSSPKKTKRPSSSSSSPQQKQLHHQPQSPVAMSNSSSSFQSPLRKSPTKVKRGSGGPPRSPAAAASPSSVSMRTPETKQPNGSSLVRTVGDFQPTFTKMFIPSNKEIAYVFPHDSKKKKKDKNSDGDPDDDDDDDDDNGHDDVNGQQQRRRRLGLYRGSWQVPKYRSGFSSSSLSSDRITSTRRNIHGDHVDEVWIFRDDDEDGIDPRVYENNPPTGRWGYAPSVHLRWITRPSRYVSRGNDIVGSSTVRKTGFKQRVPTGGASTVDPSQMWFFPPNFEEKQSFPDGFQQMGDWVQPVYQRDMSTLPLSPGASGFFSLPFENSPGGTKGKWKVLGVGSGEKDNDDDDDVVVIRRGRKKEQKEIDAAAVNKKREDANAATAVTASPTSRPSTTTTTGKGGLRGLLGDTGRNLLTKKPSVRRSQAASSSSGSRPSTRVGPAGTSNSKQTANRGIYQIWIKPKSSSSRPFPLQAQPGFKVGQCRQKIMKMRGIPLENISLSITNQMGQIVQLDDDTRTLQSLGIQNGNTVVLAPITIYVRTNKGKKIKLSNIDPEISIQQLKQLVEEKEGTPISGQGLFYNRIPMSDGSSIAKYKVKHKSNVDLKPISPDADSSPKIVRKKLSVRPKTLTAESTAATANPITRKPSIKRVPPKRLNDDIPPAPVATRSLQVSPSPSPKPESKKPTLAEITVISPIGKKIPIFMAPDDDVDDLKRKAAKKAGLSADHLTLLQENDDDHSRSPGEVDSNYTPSTGDTLRIAPVVTVHFLNTDKNQDTFKQSILPGKTIIDVKTSLASAYGMNVEDQQIFTKDDRSLDNELNDNLTIDRNIELVVRVRPTLVEDIDSSSRSKKKISVQKWDGALLKLEVQPDLSAGEFRKLVAQKVGLPLASTRLENKDEEEIDYRTYVLCEDDFFKVGFPRVVVMMPDGAQIELEAEPDTTIEDIKDILEDETDTSKLNQRLYLAGQFDEELDNSMPIDKDMELQFEVDESESGKITVTICEPNGRTFYVEIDPQKSPSTFRETVADKVMISLDELRLCKNDVDVDEHFFPDDGDILIVKRPRIAVKPPFGKTLYLDKRPGYTAEDITAKVSDELGLPKEELRLFIDGERIDSKYVPMHGDNIMIGPPEISIELPNGSKLELSASAEMTVVDVKKAIRKDTGIEEENQLIYVADDSAVEVRDDMQLKRDTRLRMEVKKKAISMTVNAPDDSSFLLVLKPDDTPDSLRERISKKSGIPRAELRLTIDEDLIDDNYIPEDGAIVDIDPPCMNIQLHDGTSLELSAPPGTTILDVKETLEEETGVPACNQRLVLTDGDGDVLENDMPITNDVDVTLLLREEIKFVVVSPEEVAIPITIDAKDPPEGVRQKISTTVGIPIAQLRLLLDETELDNDYVPIAGDTIHIAPPTINVELPDGEILELEAPPGTTIADLKETLAEEIDIPASTQWFFDLDNEGKVVADEVVIKLDMNLRLEGPVDVTVKNLDGEAVLLSFEPGSDMRRVKSIVAKNVGVPVKVLRLSMGGNELGREYTPSKGDILRVELPRIHVQFPDKSRKEIEISPRQSIADLKKIIESEKGIAANSQQIFFFQGNAVLEDEVLFSRTDFVDGTVLECRIQKPKVRIETCDSRFFEMEFEQSDTKNDIRYKIAREIGVPTQDLKLTMDGSPLDRRYKPSSGQILKADAPQLATKLENISEGNDQPEPTQKGTSKAIPDKSSPSQNSELPPFSFLQKASPLLSGPKTDSDSDHSDPKFVEEESSDQIIIRTSQKSDDDVESFNREKLIGDEEDDESSSGSDDDQDGEETINVTIITSDLQTIELELEYGTTVADVKETAEEDLGFKCAGMKITVHGEAVDDDFVPSEGDILAIEPHTIVVTLPDGNSLELSALPTTTVDDVKAYLEEETGVSRAQQRLTFFDCDTSILSNDLPINKDTKLKMEKVISHREDKSEASEIISEDWSSDDDLYLEEKNASTDKKNEDSEKDSEDKDNDYHNKDEAGISHATDGKLTSSPRTSGTAKTAASTAASGALDVLKRAERMKKSDGDAVGDNTKPRKKDNDSSLSSLGSVSSMNDETLSSLDARIAKIKERTEARRKARASLG